MSMKQVTTADRKILCAARGCFFLEFSGNGYIFRWSNVGVETKDYNLKGPDEVGLCQTLSIGSNQQKSI